MNHILENLLAKWKQTLSLQGLKNLLVRGSDLTFSNPVKIDGPVETVAITDLN
jgi:hypothetical protein